MSLVVVLTFGTLLDICHHVPDTSQAMQPCINDHMPVPLTLLCRERNGILSLVLFALDITYVHIHKQPRNICNKEGIPL